MHIRQAIPLVALLLAACDAERGDGDGEPASLGQLEYAGGVNEIYREGHRVEVVVVTEPDHPRACGFLTDRAYDDIEQTIAALDPKVDYDFERGNEPCKYSDSPAAEIYIEGFEHSPFSCDSFCCRPELSTVAITYLHVANNLEGTVLEVDGEPYVAIDPEKPCP